MTIDLGFAPDGARARLINARMNQQLGLSLRHVCEASRGELAFDQTGMARLVDDLCRGVDFAPGVFGRYYDLVLAIENDDTDAAIQLFAELTEARPAPLGFQVHALGSPLLGTESARYLRMMNDDASVDIGFLTPGDQVASDFRTRLDAGFVLVDEVLPELSSEIRAIIRQIVIAGSDPSKAYQFDGGSHYQLWGALFLNGQYHPDQISVAEVLAHECAHSLLFGFCIDEALVDNDDDEVFASPLRVDRRPMDGIYHATFVSARMHWAMSRLSLGAILCSEERERARAAADADLINFDAGYEVVAEHGRLTPLGRGLMSAAKAYADSVR